MPGGTRKVKFYYNGIFNEILDKIGLMPLPPYIHEELKEKDRYQTVYAKYNGSAAAPTAGLHFTPKLLKQLEEKGVKIANVTLHVGIGTFRPVKEETVEAHEMHSEHFYIKQEDCDIINKAKKEGKRVIAVGTTSCRVLETIADEKTGEVKPIEGDTQIFIYPGYEFKCIDGLITNFHLPQSTLLMLVSAFAGKDFVMNAYEEAVKEKYRFFSFGDGLLEAEVLDIMPGGTRKVEFHYEGIFNEILDKIGLMPLPPYIHEELKDRDRYQTVYAKYNGSAAAPTAGLHFTPELLKQLEEKGVKIANVTLHVGIGTFRPVKEETVEAHEMHSEHFYIKQEDADKINETKKQGHRVIAVGTTSCRVLETIADEDTGMVNETEGDTKIFIYPGYKFKCIDGLITNFHLPQSTLLMLVSALAGKDFIMNAYNEAVKEKYRFFSFGDAMYIS